MIPPTIPPELGVPQGFDPSSPFPPEGGLTTPDSALAPPDFSQMEPPPLPDEPLPEQANEQFIAEAWPYIQKWCRASYEFVGKKRLDIEQARADLHGKLGLNDFAKKNEPTEGSPQVKLDSNQKTPESYKSDFLWPSSHAAISIATQGYNAIFGGSEWLTVQSLEAPFPQAPLDLYSKAYRIERLLIEKAEEGRIWDPISQALTRISHLTVPAKILWYHKAGRRRMVDPNTLELKYDETPIQEFPCLQLIEPDYWLPDWKANCSDIQRWSGIGHISEVTYHEVLAGFTEGVYTLNREEFIKQFENVEALTYQTTNVEADPDAEGLTDDPRPKLWMVEWHGQVWDSTAEIHRECCANFCMQVGQDSHITSFEDATLVRLTMEPILHCGLRPFVVGQWWSEPAGAYCMTLFDQIREIRYMLSQILAQIQDLARIAASGTMGVREGSLTHRHIQKNGLNPFQAVPFEDPSDIIALPLRDAPLQAMDRARQDLQLVYERISLINETFQGISGNEKTASEAVILDKRAQGPFQAILDRFCRTFVEPALNLFLALCQQYLWEDQMITDDAGNPVPLGVTVDDLKSGRFRVKVTVVNQELATAAKANSFREFLQSLPGLQPLLQAEGWMVQVHQVCKRYLDQFNQDGVDRILTRITDPNMLMQMQQTIQQAPVNGQQPPQNWNGGPMGAAQTDQNVQAQSMQSGMQGGPFA